MTANLRIDHVTLAGSDLDRLRGVLSRAGLASVYGGAHSNGVTHMALVGLGDTSYLELISTLDAEGPASPLWPRLIAGDAGACAWALRTDDLAAELERVAALGVPVRGPVPLHRRRPDGVDLRWQLGFLGAGEVGSFLPFLIEDETPRELRVGPALVAGTSPRVEGEAADGQRTAPVGPLAEVACVVLASEEVERDLESLERVYGLARGAEEEWPELDARVVALAGGPVAIASPTSSGGWLGRRLRRFGPSPCAFLLRATGAPSPIHKAQSEPGKDSLALLPGSRHWLDLPGWPWLRLALVS